MTSHAQGAANAPRQKNAAKSSHGLPTAGCQRRAAHPTGAGRRGAPCLSPMSASTPHRSNASKVAPCAAMKGESAQMPVHPRREAATMRTISPRLVAPCRFALATVVSIIATRSGAVDAYETSTRRVATQRTAHVAYAGRNNEMIASPSAAAHALPPSPITAAVTPNPNDCAAFGAISALATYIMRGKCQMTRGRGSVPGGGRPDAAGLAFALGPQ